MNTKDIKYKGYWTKEKCLEEAKLYKTKEEFKRHSGSAYTCCIKNKWIYETNLTGNKKWTKEECLEVIKRCSNKKEVRNISEKVYRILISNRWNIQNDIVWI